MAAKYYNKSSGSLAVTLKSGRSASLAGKSWTVIPSEEEGAEDLQLAVKRGFLVRVEIPVEVAPAAAVAMATEDGKLPEAGQEASPEAEK